MGPRFAASTRAGLLLVAVLLPGTARAGNNVQATLDLHVVPAVSRNVCAAIDGLTPSQVQPTAYASNDPAGCVGSDYTAYVLVVWGSSIGGFEPEGTGVAGVEFGIDYTGMTITQATRCSDLDFPSLDWPGRGSGTIATWDPVGNCQSDPSYPFVPNTTLAVAYALQVHTLGPERLYLTPRPVSGAAKVSDCNSAEDDLTHALPSHLGFAGFCTPGYAACCTETPVEPVSWGRIKRTFQRE